MITSTSKPKVSICLPIFNGASYLPEAIESVLKQSFTDFELLIADDGSTDGSTEIAKKFAAIDESIIFWTNKKRLGLFANYNACLAKAQGIFIKLFAQDDSLEQHTVARMTEVLDTNPKVALVSGGKSWIDQAGIEIKRIIQFPENRLMQGKEAIVANLILLGNWVGEPSLVMFRAQDVGSGFNCNYYHYGDIEYWFRLLAKGDLYYISDVLCKFRRHAASSTATNLAGLYFALDILRLGEQYQGLLAEIGESKEHFFKRAVETIALHVDHLVRNEGLDLDKVIAVGSEHPRSGSPGSEPLGSGLLGSGLLGSEPGLLRSELLGAESLVGAHCMRPLSEASLMEPASAVSDNAILRQALFHFSRRVTELLEERIETNNELEHRQAECKRLWEAVDQMSNSVSWKVTAPLRTVREKMNHSTIQK
jgi:glycosyltransferase involved in cell wall biosynthesis